MTRKLEPIHPGEILYEEFMRPMKINANRLALDLRVPAPTVYDIVNGRRAISDEMALRLARYFNNTPEFWVNLQARYNLEMTRDKKQQRIEREIVPVALTYARKAR